MFARVKKLGAMLAICFMLGGAGAIGGQAMQSAVSPTPAVASCEDDECEGVQPVYRILEATQVATWM